MQRKLIGVGQHGVTREFGSVGIQQSPTSPVGDVIPPQGLRIVKMNDGAPGMQRTIKQDEPAVPAPAPPQTAPPQVEMPPPMPECDGLRPFLGCEVRFFMPDDHGRLVGYPAWVMDFSRFGEQIVWLLNITRFNTFYHIKAVNFSTTPKAFHWNWQEADAIAA